MQAGHRSCPALRWSRQSPDPKRCCHGNPAVRTVVGKKIRSREACRFDSGRAHHYLPRESAEPNPGPSLEKGRCRVPGDCRGSARSSRVSAVFKAREGVGPDWVGSTKMRRTSRTLLCAVGASLMAGCVTWQPVAPPPAEPAALAPAHDAKQPAPSPACPARCSRQPSIWDHLTHQRLIDID